MRNVISSGFSGSEIGVYGRTKGFPFSFKRGAWPGSSASGAVLIVTHDATGSRDAVPGGSSNVNLWSRAEFQHPERVAQTHHILCGIVVIRLDLLQLKVDPLVLVQGTFEGLLRYSWNCRCGILHVAISSRKHQASDTQIDGGTRALCGRLRRRRISAKVHCSLRNAKE